MSNAEPASPAAELSWRPTYDPSQSELTFFEKEDIHQQFRSQASCDEI